MKSDNNIKIGMSSLNWILSIFGIVFFLCLIVLPPLFRNLYSKKENLDEKKQIVTEYLTCSINNNATDNYVENNTYKFTYKEDKLYEYTYVSTRTYSSISLFDQDKLDLSKLTTAYSLSNGTTFTASPNETNMTITIRSSYNLNNFKNTNVIIPGSTDKVEVKSSYNKDEKVSDIKVNLQASGYDCK